MSPAEETKAKKGAKVKKDASAKSGGTAKKEPKPKKDAAPREKKAKTRATVEQKSPYNAERLATVLLAPVVSEKGTYIADKYEQEIFKVMPNATKPEVKAAVEAMFKVQVETVQIVNVRGKEKRFGRYIGRRRSWKKAYVCLAPGQEINFGAES
jgi:large subunit ribosomal protein L23